MTDKSWQARSACTPDDSYLFYPDSKAEAREYNPAAKFICASCRVRTACLEDALHTRDEFGTAGGLTASERHKLLDGKLIVCKRGHDVSGPRARDPHGNCRQCRRENERATRARKSVAA